MSGYELYDVINDDFEDFNFVEEIVAGLAFNGLIFPTAIVIFIFFKFSSKSFNYIRKCIRLQRYRPSQDLNPVV